MADTPSTSPTAKVVGIWIRVSTEDQARGESPEHHEKRARYYAESRGWRVAEVYRLEAVSGKSVMEHPEAQRMLADVRAGRVTGIIFSKLARLARNTRELLEFADIFRGINADLVSLQEAIDTSTPAGRLFYTMIAVMAQWEREEIAERISASVSVRAKLGKPLNGKVAYGYQWKDRKIVPHPDEAPVRRLVHELFLQLRRKKAVARVLNERGYRTREGRPFTDASIEFMLRDPTAKGMHRANYTKRGNGQPGQHRAVKPESDWVWTPVEPIVPAEVWDECNRYLDDRRANKFKRPGKRPVHLFAGYVYCTCGRKMYVKSNSPKYACQSCRNRIPVVDLDAVYCEELRKFFLSPTAVAERLAEGEEHAGEKRKLLESLEAESTKVQREMQATHRLYTDERIDGPGFEELYKPLAARRKQLADEIPRLTAELDVARIDELSTDAILNEAHNLYDRWLTLTHEEKRRVVENITDRITIGEGEIEISLCHVGTSEPMAKWQGKLSPAYGGEE